MVGHLDCKINVPKWVVVGGGGGGGEWLLKALYVNVLIKRRSL